MLRNIFFQPRFGQRDPDKPKIVRFVTGKRANVRLYIACLDRDRRTVGRTAAALTTIRVTTRIGLSRRRRERAASVMKHTPRGRVRGHMPSTSS